MEKRTKISTHSSNKVNVKSDNNKIRKEIVRNPQVPLRENAVKTFDLNPDIPENSVNVLNEVTIPQSNRSSKTSGSTYQFKNPSNSKEKKVTDKLQDEVKKVNIPFSEKKYSGLVDLGSLEAVLAERNAESSSAATVNKRRACLPNRDPEPVLSDYFTPKFDTEYVFTFPTAPIKITKEWTYNPRRLVDIVEKMESNNSNADCDS